MSSRALKKLHGDNELNFEEKESNAEDGNLDISDEETELSAAGDKNKQFNLNRYDLLNQQSLSESEVKEDDNETEHASTAANAPSSNTSKKKKKKRKKKSAKHSGHHISSEDNDLTDKLLNDLQPILKKAARQSNVDIAAGEAAKTLLSVEYKHLNPQNEMRRTFGKRVVKIDNKRGRFRPTLKCTYLVTSKDTWPPVVKDLISMKPCSPPDNRADSQMNWFTFEHSKFYQGIQNMFLSAVERIDSDFLVNLIQRCPYHVDSLVQLSELCKMTENFSVGAELIERAVLALETSVHPTFSLTSGTSRLDYRRQENRSFFVVLFKHAQYLEARACCRTAFELSKLILSLNVEEDPLAVVLIIDYYAVRSRQYAWLVKFYEEWDSVKNLSQLPNMAYSYALALFYTVGVCEKSNNALQYALMMFPGVLKPLLDELSVQTDQRVIGHTYFNSGVHGSQSPALHQLVSLYMCRAKVIWRDTDVLNWLETNVNTVLDRVDSKDDIVAEFNSKRSQRYVNPPRAILRHVVISDYKEKVPLATFIAKEKDPIVAYDPLPPLDSINFYNKKSSNASSPTNQISSQSLQMFFQSMFPNFQLQGEQGNNRAAPVNDEEQQVDRQLEALNANLGEIAEAEAANGGGVQAHLELRQSVTSIVDAMREFLSNIRITEQSQNADGEGNGSTEEDTSDTSD